MKRRRGNKKGKAKKPKLVSTTNEVTSNAVSQNTEDSNNNSGLDEFDNEEVESGMDAEPEPETKTMPPVPEIIQPEKPTNVDSIGRPLNNTFGKAVYTRVKVKIKTSKNLDTQHTSPDAPSQSDTDKCNHQLGLGKQAPLLNEKTEDSANSLSETNGGVSENNASQKPVGIKIKSRGLGSSSMSPCNRTELVKGEKKDNTPLHQESRYNEQELKTALEVIRKVMEMDAAEPFNAPVNPDALGIPDYFDVISTPMDFGTICSNLEKGVKYENSEDVFRDVQYIWDNCYKYNNKGNFIVELMKRVKKNFTKYWTAVGLFNDQPQENNNGSEGNPIKDLSPSSEENTPSSNGAALNLLSKKFHGLKHHKEGCQCAICVMMRRRQEREEIARLMGRQTEGSDGDSMDEDTKLEGTSNANSPFGGYASSNMENSPHVGAELERKDQEMKLGHIRSFYAQQMDDVVVTGRRAEGHDLHLSQRSADKNIARHLAPQIGIGGTVLDEIQKEISRQNDDGISTSVQQQRPKEPLDKHQRAKMLENLRYLENPMLMELYGTLFADNSQSFWNGPHSLVGRSQDSKQQRSLRSAISSLMK